jgi:hypothetical protein
MLTTPIRDTLPGFYPPASNPATVLPAQAGLLDFLKQDFHTTLFWAMLSTRHAPVAQQDRAADF